MKFPKIIEDELKRCDVPFIVKRGSRHWKIFIGTMLCGIFPMNGKSTNRRAELNLRSQIRRQVKITKEEHK